MRCLNCKSKFIPKYFLGKFCDNCRDAEREYQNEKRKEQADKMRAGFKPIQKQTAKNVEKRKVERNGFAIFFVRHIEKITRERIKCENCNNPIFKPSSCNIAHIISKSKHLEVATNDENVIYLCSDCHSAFDQNLSKRETMPAFKIAVAKIKPILHLVTSKSKELTQIEDYIDNNNF